MNFVMYRIYIFYVKQHNKWSAEGFWWDDSDFDNKTAKGTIATAYSKESASEAIDTVLSVAKQMNIDVSENVALDYNKDFLSWSDNPTYKKYMQRKDVEEILDEECNKRNWITDY